MEWEEYQQLKLHLAWHTSPCWSSLPSIQFISWTLSPSLVFAPTACTSMSLSTEKVRKELSWLYSGRVAGPDGISPKVVLLSCVLSGTRVLNCIRSWLSQGHSVLSLSTKTSHPTTSNDHRPAALTLQVMKILERIIPHNDYCLLFFPLLFW